MRRSEVPSSGLSRLGSEEDIMETRRRSNDQDILQHTDCMCMSNALPSLNKNLNNLHDPTQQSLNGMEMEMQAYMCYIA